ncbi:MAG: lipopolysaccharide heptosyltransferase II [Candidatus Rifleibacteriota bacterium]
MAGILIIRLKGLGDIVHLIPTLRMLKRDYPDKPLALLCQKPFGQIIPQELDVKLFELPAHAGIAETISLLEEIRKCKFEYLFDLFANPRTAIISLLSGISNRFGFDYRYRKFAYSKTYKPADPNLHLMRLFADFFAEFGFPGEIDHPRLVAPEVARKSVENALKKEGIERPLLGINPHTTYPSKSWPEEYFVKFIELWFAHTGKKTMVTWGPGEEPAARRITEKAGPEKAFLQPPANIMEFAAILAQLDFFLTADTGPMNIAWAVGTPTTTLFGPTTRKAVAPRGDSHLTLFNEEIECLQCHLEQCSHRSCMRSMLPEWVFGKMRQKYKF